MHAEARRDTFKIAVSDSSGETFSAFVVILGVESVRKIETGLECCQRLPRKLRKKVATAPLHLPTVSCSVTHFPRQPLTRFESFFVFWDQFSTKNTCNGRKHSKARIRDRDFARDPPLTVILNFLGHFLLSQQPLALFEFCFVFLDNSTPVNTWFSLKYSAARFRVAKFESE